MANSKIRAAGKGLILVDELGADALTADSAGVAGKLRPWGGGVWDPRSSHNPAGAAAADAKAATGGAITSGTAILTVSGGDQFTAGDVGKSIWVPGAGASGAALASTIAAWTSSTEVTLTDNASATVSGKKVAWGTDDTAAVRAATAALIAAGGGRIEHGAGRYLVLPSTADTAPLGDFANLTGIELAASGAEYVVVRDFLVDAVQVKLFAFDHCHQIRFGDFRGRYTGERETGDVRPDEGIYRRGATFAYFTGGCTGIHCGTLEVIDFNYSHWYHEDAATPIEDGSRGIDFGIIQATRTGYGLLTHRAGHNMRGRLITHNGGRSAQIQDTDELDLVIDSADHQASQDVGLTGQLSGRVHYINTRSTTIPAIGRGIGIHIPTLADSPGRITRGLKIELTVKTTAGAYLGRAFTLGMATGVDGADADPAYLLDGLEVTGTIIGGTSSQQMVVVEFPSAWTEGQNLRNLSFRNLLLVGGGASAFDLRGLADLAVLQNIGADANLQVLGNTVGKISCIDVSAPEVFSVTGDTTPFNIDLIGCEITTGANLTLTTPGRRIVNTSRAGVVQNTYVQLGQALQSFTLVLTNTAGTLQHQIVTDLANAAASAFASRIAGASAALANTPTVDAVTPFASGVGVTGNQVVLDTAAQTVGSTFLMAQVEYYDGGVSRPNAYAFFNSMDVNGTNRLRLHVRLTDALSGAAWNVDTTNLPAGKSLAIRFMGWVA